MTAELTASCALRLALPEDIQAVERLIELSTRELQSAYYSPAQLDAALGSIFGVDRQLIADQTYFVVEHEPLLIGCGGWSKRQSLYGSDTAHPSDVDAELNPQHDAARVRAFFVHPQYVRRGVARAILLACETAIAAARFRSIELVATLAGVPFYARCGYATSEESAIPLRNGLTLPVVRMTKNIPAMTSR